MQGLLKSPLVNVIRLLLALALVAPLLVTADPWPGTVYHFVVGKALWTRTLTAFALALWLILLLREPAYRPPKSWLLAIFGVYLLIGLLAALFGISPTRSLWSSFERMNGWVGLAHWCAYLLVLASVFRAWRQWRALFNFGVGIGLLLGLLGLYEYFRLGPFHYVNWENTRISITFGNPTYVGGFAAVNLFLAGALLVSSFIPDAADAAERRRAERRRQQRATPGFRWLTAVNGWRLFWIAAILLSLTILWLSGSRGGALSVAVGLSSVGLGYAFWGVGRWRRIAAALVGPALVLALAAYASGELYALRAENGRVSWSDNLAFTERLATLASLNDIQGGAVADRGLVFASSYSGRLVAIDLDSGARVWERPIASAQTPWPAGDHLYVVTASGRIVCLLRADGRIRWVRQLPAAEDGEDETLWSGPILAGGRLLVAASDGRALALSPHNGDTLQTMRLGSGLPLAPIAAGGTVFLVEDSGRIVALR